MSELVHVPQGSLVEKVEWAKFMATANLLPREYRNNPGNLLFAAEYADALGIDRINATTSIHVIEGKPSASAELIAGLVRRAGHKLRIVGDDTRCVAQLIRSDDPDFTYEATWDADKARAAGLWGKGNWSKYPGAMLRSRAITEVARMGASEVLLGVVYTPEELGAEVDANGDIINGTRVTAEHIPTAAEGAPSGTDRMREFLGDQQPVSEPAPQTDVAEGSPVETSVAEGEAGSSPAGNTSAASEPDGITSAQLKKMGASMREIGLTDRKSALAYVKDVIGREIDTRNDLTKAEAHRVIDALERDQQDVVDAEIVPDPAEAEDTVWEQIVTTTTGMGWDTDRLTQDFKDRMGMLPDDAAAVDLQAYLELVQSERAA